MMVSLDIDHLNVLPYSAISYLFYTMPLSTSCKLFLGRSQSLRTEAESHPDDTGGHLSFKSKKVGRKGFRVIGKPTYHISFFSKPS